MEEGATPLKLGETTFPLLPNEGPMDKKDHLILNMHDRERRCEDIAKNMDLSFGIHLVENSLLN